MARQYMNSSQTVSSESTKSSSGIFGTLIAVFICIVVIVLGLALYFGITGHFDKPVDSDDLTDTSYDVDIQFDDDSVFSSLDEQQTTRYKTDSGWSVTDSLNDVKKDLHRPGFLFLKFMLGLVILIVVASIIGDRFRNPFGYPLIQTEIDITGRRQPSYDECIDEWLINHRSFDAQEAFEEEFSSWNARARNYLSRTWFWKNHKRELYESILGDVDEDYEMFEFVFYRTHTRYRQQNYQKIPYEVQDISNVETLSLSDMLEIEDSLEEIDYVTTRKKYFAKNQRKLMTKELRRHIIERDNWTCKICGKYMPDEVGLHVDHIVPIKNGGKTIPANLQVTCDKCNLSKGSK